MKKILKILGEPVILFFILGILLFLIYTKATQAFDRKNKTIVVKPEQVELLTANFQKTWRREPNEEELQSIVDNYIMDEVFYKEATALGIEKSDPAIKRRLRQIMEGMLDDLTTVYPSEDQLNKYLSENPEKFQTDPLISFRQLYFNFDDKQSALAIKDKLVKNEKVNANELRQLSLLPEQFENESYRMIERTFGQIFTEALFDMDIESWQGPVESAYGWHIVYISKVEPGDIRPLDEIWDLVEREWTLESKQEQKKIIYNKMKENYIILFEDNE